MRCIYAEKWVAAADAAGYALCVAIGQFDPNNKVVGGLKFVHNPTPWTGTDEASWTGELARCGGLWGSEVSAWFVSAGQSMQEALRHLWTSCFCVTVAACLRPHHHHSLRRTRAPLLMAVGLTHLPFCDEQECTVIGFVPTRT